MIKCKFTGEHCSWHDNEPIFKIGTITSCDSEAMKDLSVGKNYYAGRKVMYHFDKIDGEWYYEVYYRFNGKFALPNRYHAIDKEYADRLIAEKA